MAEPGAGRPATARRLLNLRCIVDAAVLVGLLVFLAQAVQPDFRGGRFVTLVLLIATVFAAVILTSEVTQAIAAGRRCGAGAAESATAPGSREQASWPAVWHSLATVVALFVLVLFLGTVVGMTILAWIVLRWHIGAGIVRATAIAVVLGLIVPAVFSAAIGVPPWPGLVPDLVPGWVGGGILPSL